MTDSQTAAPVEVVTLGEPLALLLAGGDVPLPQASQFDLSVAGAESNVAIGLARLGHEVAYVGLVGDDVFGSRIRRDLRAEGVRVDALSTHPERPTGLLIRDAPVGRPVTVVYRRSGSAAAALSPDHIPVQLIRAARHLHVTGITPALSPSARAATVRAASIAREAGASVSFDPNVRMRLATAAQWQEIADELGRLADVVLVGAEEATVLAGSVPASEWFAARGARTVIVKDGARGAVEHDLTGSAIKSTHQPAVPVPLVDPVGAGDAFDAGWLSGWLRGLPAQDRMYEAAVVASLVVATRGDCRGLPDAMTRDRIVAAGSDVDR